MAHAPTISTHVLDTGSGRPARGVPVRLYRLENGTPVLAGQGETDGDGRIPSLLSGPVRPGTYQIEFDVASYARSQGRDFGFFAGFVAEIQVADANRSYHVPLILSPHSAMTYLGS